MTSRSQIRKPRPVRFSDDEWKAVKKAAKKAKTPVSTWVRQVALEAAKYSG